MFTRVMIEIITRLDGARKTEMSNELAYHVHVHQCNIIDLARMMDMKLRLNRIVTLQSI